MSSHTVVVELHWGTLISYNVFLVGNERYNLESM